MHDNRARARLAFAQRNLNGPALDIEVASADASFRSYWRVSDGAASWIVMDAPPAQEDVRPWLEGGDIPATVEQNAEICGTDVLGYVTERPGLSVHALADGTVYRTYVTTARGLEAPGMAYYALLDRTPKGRDESATEPLWIRHHDAYGG